MKPCANLLFLAVALAATPATANITLGTGPGANCAPFSCLGFASPNPIFQQVYAASAFSAPISITAVRFERWPQGGSALASGTFTLSVSTTSVTPTTINTSDFAANIGRDNVTVFSGGLRPNFDGQFLTFAFNAPYLYDPANGSLLLNFSISGPSRENGFIAFFKANNGDAANLFSRAYNTGTGFIGYGLHTTFIGAEVPSVIPEPATWAMMIAGFGLVGAAARRRRLAPG